MSTLRRAFLCLCLALSLVAATSASSLAAQSLGLSVVAWVQSIDASPDWTARMRGLSVDEAQGALTINSLVVAAQAGEIALEIDGATLAGYREAPEGGFAASSLRIARATVKTGSKDVILTDIVFDDVEIPSLIGLSYDRSKPFTSLIAAYSAVAKMALAGGRIGNIDFLETFDGITSKITYEKVVIGPIADGKIGALSAGPLRVESPSPNPLVELSVAGAEAHTIDLDAILHVYDPLRYVAGVSDGVWHPAIGTAAYSDIRMTLPGVALALGSVSLENFRVRQPGESFAPLVDAMMADRPVPPNVMDALNSRYLAGLLSAYGVGRFTIEGAELRAVGIDQLAFGLFNLSEASSDGIGEVAIEGFVGAIAGQGAVVVNRFAVGDIVAPPLEKLIAAFNQLERGVDVDVSALAPRLGSLEASGIDIQAIDFPGASLGRLRADFGNYVVSVPTEIVVDIDDFDVATPTLQPPRIRNLIASLGYDRIEADTNLRIFWNEEDGKLALDDFHLDIKDFGNISANIVLAGLTRAAIGQSEEPGDFLGDLLFDQASVTFEDKSLVERSLSMRAELLKIPLDRLKQQLAGALPLMLAFVGDPEKVKEIVPVLQDFIKSPGTLMIEAAPEPAIPVAAIKDAVRSRPQSLPGMLGITITGKPRAAGPAAPDGAGPKKADSSGEPPPIRQTLEPQSRPGTTGSTTPAAPP